MATGSQRTSPGEEAAQAAPLRVAIFDDVVAARAEQFHLPGVEVEVFADADDVVAICSRGAYHYVFMDYALGSGHQGGDAAIAALRAAGFAGKVVAISSDPAANDAMVRAGADESLAKKAHLRSYLVHLGAQNLGRAEP